MFLLHLIGFCSITSISSSGFFYSFFVENDLSECLNYTANYKKIIRKDNLFKPTSRKNESF